MTIKQNLEILKNELKSAPVTIVAVSKYATVAQIIEAYQAGLRVFGESKIQSITQKFDELPEEIVKNSEWHLIGHLQTNKVKKVIGTFKLIHSVDSVKLAEKIAEEAKVLDIKQDILLQVNISQEETKHGFNREDIANSFSEINKLENINIKGLMTMAPFTEDVKIQRECFRNLRELRDNLQGEFKVRLPELSMGMSNDYKIAVEEGSTLIRVGQKIFA